MADECMQAFPELQPIKYDLPFYREYMKHIKKIVKRLNTEGIFTLFLYHPHIETVIFVSLIFFT